MESDQNTSIQNLILKVEKLTTRVQQFEEENKILRQEKAALKKENPELIERLNPIVATATNHHRVMGIKNNRPSQKKIKGQKVANVGIKAQT